VDPPPRTHTGALVRDGADFLHNILTSTGRDRNIHLLDGLLPSGRCCAGGLRRHRLPREPDAVPV